MHIKMPWEIISSEELLKTSLSMKPIGIKIEVNKFIRLEI